MAFNQDAMTCILGAISTKSHNGFLAQLGWAEFDLGGLFGGSSRGMQPCIHS